MEGTKSLWGVPVPSLGKARLPLLFHQFFFKTCFTSRAGFELTTGRQDLSWPKSLIY